MQEHLLQQDERIKLIDIVAKLYDFTDLGIRGRRVFIQDRAGLGRFVPGFNFEGSPRTVASDLVGKLERFGGELPELPTYHSLGALMVAMLNLGELNNEDAAFIAGLIVRYSLVADIDYLERLRQQYNIAEKAIREPPANVILPRAEIGKEAEGPRFEPQIGNEQALEQIINSKDNFLDIYLLYGALYCAQGVGMIEIPQGKPQGTGFLVGPNLLLTNQHVLKEKSYLEEAVVRFSYMKDNSGVVAGGGQVVRVLNDFYHSSPADELDYALVRLEAEPLKNKVATEKELKETSIEQLALIGKHRGYLVLAPSAFTEHSRVNIIQHPDGQPLKVVMTQNYVVYKTDSRVQYVADTMNGSSGSPVFNHKWEVVALHHSGRPYPPESLTEAAKKAWKGRFRVNEGIPMKAILQDFKDKGIDRYLPRE